MNLKELSQKLGLSQTTVSRALNGYPEVSAATRKRVQEAAKASNYRPSTRAKGLATGKALTIGHVIPVSSKHEIVNPVFGDFIAGASETYARNGYEMLLSIVDDAQEEQIYRGMKSRQSVDGVIVHGPKMNDLRIGLLSDLGLPFAVHGRASGCDIPYTWLDMNNRQAFERATRYLLELGHRRIGLINGLEEMDFAYRRRNGYIAAHRSYGIATDPQLMRSDEMTEAFGYESSRDMLRQANPPTAIIVSSLICALGARRAVEEHGLTMGKDVSIVSHDDVFSYLQNGNATPIFTATRSSVRDAGRQLAEMLLNVIRNPTAPPRTVLLDAELVIGGSTGPAPRKD
ncbi:LacI family DNA-binding transcriptional regulator [Yoonia sediminilitoris]|uniref:LacI family transcriptional regulator n=1 Tax=Yoonia sediminilitoris TaxID=1286148 RepID=A0A2T6KRR5_9RHOB|nr:substrate-binding domain-containing protein [Yoonia sediminilitoris]PUB19252.1 LacI family transcriptional regulator [Yoonia sediminilitoris]RCW99420.1 LacI family transcriptional regulator [Yoonia sediminilitoris]